MTELSDLQPLGPYAPAGYVIVARPERIAAEYHGPAHLPPYPQDGKRYLWHPVERRWIEAHDWQQRDTGVRA